MFKWPGVPSAQAYKYKESEHKGYEHELADFAELVSWKDGGISMTEFINLLGKLEENDHSDGVLEQEDIPDIVEATYTEIEHREKACIDGYPFVIGEQGYTLRTSDETRNHRHIIYKYLLLATRLNMKKNRSYAGIDGTLLFEELAAEVGREYLGNRAERFVFGTASSGNFEAKVNDLCERIKEGDGFINRNEAPPTERDGKLDIVLWKHFTDELPGKLIAFGQCKTGTNYNETLTQLRPDSFCKKWLRSPPVLTPIRMFFVAEAVSRSRWHSTAYDAGLFFDRCRIVDFCDSIDPNVLGKIKIWTEAAAKDVISSTR